ncbi:ChaN family lipoprotein [Thiomicrorhabdus aquaedulcis]|uniref:ChaN family lipoprotein n=1 Tax=Thiomicrorhabdus aquaedulcis TaxID=2211106 RepID=UPI001E4568FE|nr:ChaN family lipoprotein [Thiomicrorhabdus aquaedulcis]
MCLKKYLNPRFNSQSFLYLSSLLLISLTSGCTHMTAQPLTTLYDYQIIDSDGAQPLSLQQLTDKVRDSDVVFVGEFHGNHASHLLQMHLMAQLHAQRPQQTLSMEMFNRDQQPILNRYLDGEIGETYLIKEAPAWQNYTGSYRPLVEYAKSHFIPVIAANASADIVRCIGREGAAYPDKLPSHERAYIAKEPFKDNSAYREKYMEFLDGARHLSPEKAQNNYLAQLARDNTMAESIYQAWLKHPKHQIVHLNGAFHSDEFLGTVALLKARNPALKISVISPIEVDNPAQPEVYPDDLTKGDAVYLVHRQPPAFTDVAYQQKVQQAMFKQAQDKMCY